MNSQGFSKNILKNPDGTTATTDNVGGIAFKSDVALIANGSISTGWLSYGQYLSASTVLFSDVASAVNGLKYEYSSDGGITIIDTVNVSFTTINDFKVAVFPLGKGTHIKITYTNGAIAQTKFYFAVSMSVDMVSSAGSVFTPINASNIASITKTFLNLPDVNNVNAVWDFITRTGNSLNTNITNLTTVETILNSIDTKLDDKATENKQNAQLSELEEIKNKLVNNTIDVNILSGGGTIGASLETTQLEIRDNQTNSTQITKIKDSAGTNILLGIKPSSTSLPVVFANDDTQIGTDVTGVLQLTGGTGIKGWLSGIYKRLTDTFTNSTSWFTKLTDGTNNATIKASTISPLITDTALVTSLSPNGNTIKIGETIFINSTGNTSSTQLAAGATFTGTIATLLTGKSLIISANSDQPYTVNIIQYNNLVGTQNLGTTTFTRNANIPFNEAVQMNGDYARVTITNNGGVTTTAFFVNTYFGDMQPIPTALTNKGNFKTSLEEAGIFNTIAPTLTNGNTSQLQLSTRSELKVETNVVRTTNISVTSTITVGGTAQILLASNPNRVAIEFMNLSTQDLVISFGGTASSTNGYIVAGNQGSYQSLPNVVSTVAISIFGATTGQRFTVTEYTN